MRHLRARLQQPDGLTPNLDNPLDKLVLEADWRPAVNFGLTLAFRQVSAPGSGGVPGYRALDAKTRWTPRTGLALSLLARRP